MDTEATAKNPIATTAGGNVHTGASRTCQLQRKAADLDAADNGTTTVEWCPPFLLIPYAKICRYREVAAALTAGHAYYEEDPALHQRLGPSFTLDPADVDAARLLYANPQMTAMGPNDID